jgi:uncharacterized protein (TIGR01244 family)
MNSSATHAAEAVDEGLFVHPQLTPEEMPALAASGIRSVINNRPDGEGGAAQPASSQLEAAARAAGLEYRHLPVPSAADAQTDADARRMVELVEQLPQPVLAFCRSGRRSASLYRKGKSLP